MKKVLEKLLPLVKGFVLCGVVLQIVLGILYMGIRKIHIGRVYDRAIPFVDKSL